jgi:hypothetical protein
MSASWAFPIGLHEISLSKNVHHHFWLKASGRGKILGTLVMNQKIFNDKKCSLWFDNLLNPV